MSNIRFLQTEGKSTGFYVLLAGLGLGLLAGLASVYYMEHNGHWVTGMHNRIVWGMPHVFALFLIIAASGALNVASIASVFNKKIYKPLSRLSALLALALLAGGLMVLVLDLGRPDRLIVAMTEYNFKSIFAWNIILYNGFFVVVAVYLWMMFDRGMNKYARYAGIGAFIWRFILTTGTGSIFGLLVARHSYDAVILAPKFIIMSFSFGLAFFILVLMASYQWTNRPLGDVLLNKLRNLLGVFIVGVLYFVIVFHLRDFYFAENENIRQALFSADSPFFALFWYGQILLGSLVPLFLLYYPAFKNNRPMLGLAAVLVILGGLFQLYVLIIGGQAVPFELFPGQEIIEGYRGLATYSASWAEILLGVSGIALALMMVTLLVKFLPFLPENLSDSVADPHYKKQ